MIEPFCVVSFLGNMQGRLLSSKTTVMHHIAALRFEHQPCDCAGCDRFRNDLEQFGKYRSHPGESTE
jgi:hypothetical protein